MPEDTQVYPGGEDRPAYRHTATLWLVMSLVVVCFAMVNFLVIFFKS